MTELQTEITEGRFDRNVELVVIQGDEIHAITRNRIDFRVEKFPGGQSNNRATITIYNLGFMVRGILTKRRVDVKVKPFTQVFLSAGFKSDGSTALIFRGQIIDGSNRKVGPDWISEFEAFTAWDQTQNAILSPELHNYRKTAPSKIAIDLFLVLNFTTVRFSQEAQDVIDAADKMTIAFAGRVDRTIKRFLGQFGLSYTIDDDGPLVVVSGSASNTEQVIDEIPIISVETGMVGTPKITHKGVEIKTLLNPELKIFKRFLLRSETTDGSLAIKDQEFTAMKLQHFGSNRQEDFFTELRGAFYPRFTFKTGQPDPPVSFVAEE